MFAGRLGEPSGFPSSSWSTIRPTCGRSVRPSNDARGSRLQAEPADRPRTARRVRLRHDDGTSGWGLVHRVARCGAVTPPRRLRVPGRVDRSGQPRPGRRPRGGRRGPLRAVGHRRALGGQLCERGLLGRCRGPVGPRGGELAEPVHEVTIASTSSECCFLWSSSGATSSGSPEWPRPRPWRSTGCR